MDEIKFLAESKNIICGLSRRENTEPAECYFKLILVNSCIQRLQSRKSKKAQGPLSRGSIKPSQALWPNGEVREAFCFMLQLA